MSSACTAFAHLPVAAGLQHLADLLLALGTSQGRVRWRPARAALAHRKTALADLVVQAAAGEERADADEHEQHHRAHHYDRERFHCLIVAYFDTLWVD